MKASVLLKVMETGRNPFSSDSFASTYEQHFFQLKNEEIAEISKFFWGTLSAKKPFK